MATTTTAGKTNSTAFWTNGRSWSSMDGTTSKPFWLFYPFWSAKRLGSPDLRKPVSSLYLFLSIVVNQLLIHWLISFLRTSLEDPNALGFSRDQFGRQSMSEKRHASLDAKSTDTYQRNKKLRFVSFLFFYAVNIFSTACFSKES